MAARRGREPQSHLRPSDAIPHPKTLPGNSRKRFPIPGFLGISRNRICFSHWPLRGRIVLEILGDQCGFGCDFGMFHKRAVGGSIPPPATEEKVRRPKHSRGYPSEWRWRWVRERDGPGSTFGRTFAGTPTTDRTHRQAEKHKRPAGSGAARRVRPACHEAGPSRASPLLSLGDPLDRVLGRAFHVQRAGVAVILCHLV